MPCSNVPSAVTPNTAAAHSPSSAPSTSVSCAGVHAYVRPSTPSVSASSDAAKPPSAVRSRFSRKSAVCCATTRCRTEPVRSASRVYRRSSNALSYNIFSKCGTTQPASTLYRAKPPSSWS